MANLGASWSHLYIYIIISEELLRSAFEWAGTMVEINQEEMDVINRFNKNKRIIVQMCNGRLRDIDTLSL